MNSIHFLLVFSLAAALLPAVAADDPEPGSRPPATGSASAPPSASTSASAPAPPSTVPGITRRLTFTQLGSKPVLALRTTEEAAVNFGTRGDELVTKASLRLRYVYSPALIASESHLKISLNDEVIAVLPLSRENAGRNLSADIAIDPRLIVDFNRLGFRFVGHYSAECEDPTHSSLWANVSGASELEIASRPLAVASDLALLPEPFLDRRDQRRLALPFVLPAQPSKGTLLAAGVVASWFGQHAAWRGARFPVHADQPPAGHAVVFAANGERPKFLADQPAVNAPALRIIANPADGRSKLLLVLGRDGKDLKMAADALALGNAALSGPSAVVKDAQERAPRRAYDAPNWVRLDRPMTFGELIEYPQQLQAVGSVPEPIRVNLRVPPDLFLWRSRGVPLEVRYRYTPPATVGESRLTIGINDELLRVVGLRGAAPGDAAALLPWPEGGGGASADGSKLLIPAFKLGSRSQLQFQFDFAPKKVGHCRDTQVDIMRAAVDADSKIDFSGYLHYAELPNLGYFASLGYPFTKYADLSETVVVLPHQPSTQDIETMLALAGRMGESTGHPASRMTLAGPDDEDLFQNADLLVIGVAPQQAFLERWRDRLPASISGAVRRIPQPARNGRVLYEWLGSGSGADAAIVGEQQVESMAPLAAVLGFESPYSIGRSVVAVTAVSPEDLSRVLDALDDPATMKAMRGSVVLVHPRKVTSLLVGPTYATGSLPWWTSAWFRFARHPVQLSALALLAALVLGFVVWRRWRAAARRMEESV
ncbi:MAG TPA: cellulose biosynthesis cyclic di-GMP-binding regulatory protein BcsB [Paucimonas sp.]|nr:cellulose biosynthesis cyclic di-GMP-binding regulatory protein BcsB [Paucimonas sp.]